MNNYRGLRGSYYDVYTVFDGLDDLQLLSKERGENRRIGDEFDFEDGRLSYGP